MEAPCAAPSPLAHVKCIAAKHRLSKFAQLTPHAHAAALVRHQLLYRQQHQPEAHNATMFKGHKLTHDTRSLDFAHWMLQLFELVA